MGIVRRAIGGVLLKRRVRGCYRRIRRRRCKGGIVIRLIICWVAEAGAKF